MESHGLPDQIQVSEATYLLLRDSYAFEPRGVIGVKGKGPMPVYLLQGRKNAAAAGPAPAEAIPPI